MTGGGAPEPGGDLVGPGRERVYPVRERVRDDEVVVAAELHRTAVLLTADADRALDLVAQVLQKPPSTSGARARPAAGGDEDRAGSVDDLRLRLVRAYLRQARRRPDGAARERRTTSDGTRERRAGADADAYEVLRGLRPRVRAATVLRVAHGWDLESTGSAVGLTRQRVTAVLPDVPGLAEALESIGERHRLSGAEVMAAAGGEVAPSATGLHRWWGWLLVGVAVVVLAVWAVLSRPDADVGISPTPGGGVADPDGPAGPDGRGGMEGVGGLEDSGGVGRSSGLDGLDLTPYGWHLDEAGDPPVVAMGLQRQVVVEVPYGEPVQETNWDAGHLLPGGPAAYAVLWCDLPPVDPNIEQPSARLTTGPGVVDLPCAGRDDGPPVQRVTPVPVTGPGRLELVGDLPRTGGATLALYREGALSATLPLPGRSTATPPPPVPTDAAVVDAPAPSPDEDDEDGRTHFGASVEISSDTVVRVWAGRTGSVSVLADGVPVTDDGDTDGADAPDWREQQVDLRDGRWVVYLPGTTRTFSLPEQLRSQPGQTRMLTLTVVTEGMEDDVQVILTHAGRGPDPVWDTGDR